MCEEWPETCTAAAVVCAAKLVIGDAGYCWEAGPVLMLAAKPACLWW